jgi:hypothetical protein
MYISYIDKIKTTAVATTLIAATMTLDVVTIMLFWLTSPQPWL